MKIGIIGIGILALELASRSAKNGYEVLVHNPRGNCLFKQSLEKPDIGIKMASLEETASAGIIVLFAALDEMKTLIEKLPEMNGKIILHTGNLIFNPASKFPIIPASISCKLTAVKLPKAHIIRLFNPIRVERFNSDPLGTEREKIFFIGNDSDSKNQVKIFLKNLQFYPVDLSENKQNILHTVLRLQNSTAANRKSI